MRKAWFVLFFVLALSGLIAIGLMSGFFEARAVQEQLDYAVVFDAGSSGTRMYIYKWKAGISAARGDNLVITEDLSCTTDGKLKYPDRGVDKMRTKNDVVRAFSNCMNASKTRIPDSRKSRAYIFLAATAGMRLLEIRDPALANATLGFIREYFSESKYLFKDSNQAKILSGKEESTNAWISANYFLNKFKPNADRYDNYGILDLGGASTQQAFTPTTINSLYMSFYDSIRIYGVNYYPYSYSYLCRGINEATLLYRAYLINKYGFQKQMTAACYPRNSTLTTSASELIDSGCINGLFFGLGYNFTINPSKLNSLDVYTFIGASDAATCEQEIQDILPRTPCSFPNCAFDNAYQPQLENKSFYAIRNFFFSFNNTQALTSRNLQHDWSGYLNTTSYLCSMSLNELAIFNANTRSSISQGFLTSLCLTNNYAIRLLKNYGFADLKQVNIVNQINGYTVGWTLGFLVSQLNRDDFLPYEAPPRMLPIEYFVPFVIIAAFLTILFAVLLALYGCGNHKLFRNSTTKAV